MARNPVTIETSDLRKRLRHAIEERRKNTAARRVKLDEAARAYTELLEVTAAPLAQKLANALKAEGLSFTVFTPGGGLRLASDRGRDDYIELSLDTASNPPQVVGRISHARGSRTLAEELPVKPGVAPEALSEDDVLIFLLDALGPWLER